MCSPECDTAVLLEDFFRLKQNSCFAAAAVRPQSSWQEFDSGTFSAPSFLFIPARLLSAAAAAVR